MLDLLRRAGTVFQEVPCCHDQQHCDCSNCLHQRFYGGPDIYNCLKSLSFYTMNYGPAFVSEVYHFLDCSRLLHVYPRPELKVLSLGCGFGPDLIAIRKYIADHNLPIVINYRGIDIEPQWVNLRNNTDAALFTTRDVFDGLDFEDYDLLIINKLFSTLLANGQSHIFLTVLQQAIRTLPVGSMLVFIDINLQDRGRDLFHASVAPLFRRIWKYYFPIGRAYTGDYTPIQNIRNICEIPNDLPIIPLQQVTKVVCFAYLK